jgi:hypothetical protein
MDASSLTILDNIVIDKPVIKPNENFTISFEDPNHATANWVITNSATGEVVATVNDGKLVEFNSGLSEVGSYDVAYINRDYKGINSVGEAIDHILDHIRQPIPWEQLSNVPDLANDLVLENENLTLKSNDVELANIPITNDVDIENMINSLDI